jgi:hypothetical protein
MVGPCSPFAPVCTWNSRSSTSFHGPFAAIKFVNTRGRIVIRITTLVTRKFILKDVGVDSSCLSIAPVPPSENSFAASPPPSSFVSGLCHCVRRQPRLPRSFQPPETPLSVAPAAIRPSSRDGAIALEAATPTAAVPMRPTTSTTPDRASREAAMLATGFVSRASRQDSLQVRNETSATPAPLGWLNALQGADGSHGATDSPKTPVTPVATGSGVYPSGAPANSVGSGGFSTRSTANYTQQTDEWLPRERLLPFDPSDLPRTYMFDLPGYPDGDGPVPTAEVITLRIEVIDNGCGIGPDAQARLFQPYMQVRCDMLILSC